MSVEPESIDQPRSPVRRRVIWALGVVALLVVALYAWPTPYIFIANGGGAYAMRATRWGGHVQILTADGWLCMPSDKQQPLPPPWPELAHLVGLGCKAPQPQPKPQQQPQPR